MSASGVGHQVWQTREHPRFVVFETPDGYQVAINPAHVISVTQDIGPDDSVVCDISFAYSYGLAEDCLDAGGHRVMGDMVAVVSRLTGAE